MTMTKFAATTLTTLKGERVTVNGIGYIDGFLQLALVAPPEEPRKTLYLYQMKCNGDLCDYLKKTKDCWDKNI